MLLKLTKNKLLFRILIFGLITNLLVLFDIQNFYLRAIFSFLFLTIIPGFLIMLMLKIRKIGFWEYLVYIIGLSVAFLMFGGLFINWILPLAGIDKPFSLVPILISLNAFLLVFWIIAYKRNKEILFEIRLPKLDWLNKIFFITPVIFPLLSVLGTITLNNGGSNYFTMIMFGGITVFSLLLVMFVNKLNKDVFPFVILNFALALALATSLRGWNITGHDIVEEYQIFRLTNETLHWNVSSLLGNSYNACLSLNILPTIYSKFLSINDQYIFKLFFPVIISFMPIGLYSLLYRYTKPIFACISVLFFIYFPTFFIDFPMMTRQEFSLFFYILSLLIIFNKNESSKSKKILFIIFGFSMIVSHYSTSYIALAIFISTYMFSFLYRLRENRRNRLSEKKSAVQQKHYLSFDIVVLLLIFSFIWYSQVTQISGGLTNFISNVFSDIENVNIFNKGDRLSLTSLLDQFNLFYKKNNQTQLLKNYVKETEIKYKNSSVSNFYPQSTYRDYNPKLIPAELLPNKIESSIIFSKIVFILEIIKKLMQVFIIIGVLSILFRRFKKKASEIDTEYIVMITVSLFYLIAAIVLPLISVNYSLLRVYQQMLIFLSLPAVLGGIMLFKFFKKENIKITSILIMFIIYFLTNSGFIYQIIGGSKASIQLNNYGDYYDRCYIHDYDIQSAIWLSNHINNNSIVHIDQQKINTLKAFASKGQYANAILPSVIDRGAYVYSSYTNTIKKRAYVSIKGEMIIFNFPTEFLNLNKNKIYNNGKSEIFK